MSMDAVPAGIDPAEVRRFLEKLPGVASVPDLHIWAALAARIATKTIPIVFTGVGDPVWCRCCAESRPPGRKRNGHLVAGD